MHDGPGPGSGSAAARGARSGAGVGGGLAWDRHPESVAWRCDRRRGAPGADHQRTLQRLFTTDAKIAAAVVVGSPSLFDALERSGLTGEDAAGRSAKLLRYLIRMSSRPTPYGLFAGVGIARWGAATSLSLARERRRTRTRPDMAWLLRLVFRLESEPAVRAQLRYLANPRVLARAGRMYLPEPAPSTDGSGPGAAVSVRETPVVAAALELARTPVEHERLVAALAVRLGATREKAERLAGELWRQTPLLTDLRPPLTGVNPAEYRGGTSAAWPACSASRRWQVSARSTPPSGRIAPTRSGPPWAAWLRSAHPQVGLGLLPT